MAFYVARPPEVQAVSVGDILRMPVNAIMNWLPSWAVAVVREGRLTYDEDVLKFDGQPVNQTDYLVYNDTGNLCVVDSVNFHRMWMLK